MLYGIFYSVPFLLTFASYGDILPMSSAEKWVSVVSMLWGVVLFGYILGGLASTLTTSDAQRARYIHRLNVIRDYLVSPRHCPHTYTHTHTHTHTPVKSDTSHTGRSQGVWKGEEEGYQLLRVYCK